MEILQPDPAPGKLRLSGLDSADDANGQAPRITAKVLTEAARNADRLRHEIAAIKLSVAAGVGAPSGPQQLMRSKSMEKTSQGSGPGQNTTSDLAEGESIEAAGFLSDARRRSSLERMNALKIRSETEAADISGNETRRRSSLERMNALKIRDEAKSNPALSQQAKKQAAVVGAKGNGPRAKTPVKREPITEGASQQPKETAGKLAAAEKPVRGEAEPLKRTVSKKAPGAAKQSAGITAPLSVDSPDWLDEETVAKAKGGPRKTGSGDALSTQLGSSTKAEAAKGLDFSLTAMRKHLNSTQAHGPGDMSRSTEEIKRQMLEKLRAVNHSFKGGRKSKLSGKGASVDSNRAPEQGVGQVEEAPGGYRTIAGKGAEVSKSEKKETAGKGMEKAGEGKGKETSGLVRTETLGQKAAGPMKRTASPQKRPVARKEEEKEATGDLGGVGADSARESPLERAERVRSEAAEMISRRVSAHREPDSGSSAEKRVEKSQANTSPSKASTELRSKDIPKEPQSSLSSLEAEVAGASDGEKHEGVTLRSEGEEAITLQRTSVSGPVSRRQSVSSSDKRPEFVDRAKKTAVKETLERKAENLRKFHEQKEAQAALLRKEQAEHERKRLEKLGQLPPPDPVPALDPKNDPARSTDSKPNPAATGETERQPSLSKGRALQGSLEATKKRVKAVTGAVTALNQAATRGGKNSESGRKEAITGGALSAKASVKGSASQESMTGQHVAVVEAKGVGEPVAGGHAAGAADIRGASATLRSTFSLKKKPDAGAQKMAAEAHQPQAATSPAKGLDLAASRSAQRTQSLGPEWEKAQKRAGSMEEPPEEKSSVEIPNPGHSDAVGKLFKPASPKDPSGRADSVGTESVITKPQGIDSEGAVSEEPNQSANAAEPSSPRRKQPSNGKRNGTAEAVPPGVKKGLPTAVKPLPNIIQHDNPAFSPANSPFATAGKTSPFAVNVNPEESQTPAQNHSLASSSIPPSQGPVLHAPILSPGTSVSALPGDRVPEQPKPTSRHVSTEDLFVTARDAVNAAERKLKEEPVVSPGREARQAEEGPVGTKSTREKFSSVPSFKVQRTNAGSKVSSSRRETSTLEADENGVIGKPGLARVDSRPATSDRRTGGSAARSAGADGTGPSEKEQSSFSKAMSGRGLSVKPALKPETTRSDSGEATNPSDASGASPEPQSHSSEITKAEPVMDKVGSGLKPLRIPNSRKSVTGTGSNPGTPQSIPTVPVTESAGNMRITTAAAAVPVTDSAGNMPITNAAAPVPTVPVTASAGIGRRKSGDGRSGMVVERALVQERERKMQEELDLIVGGLAYLKTNQSPAGPLASGPASPHAKKSQAKERPGGPQTAPSPVQETQVADQTVAVRRRSSATELERKRALRERLEALSLGMLLRKINKRSRGEKLRTYWVEKDDHNRVFLCWKSGLVLKKVKSVHLRAAPLVVPPASGGPVLITLQTSKGDLTLEAPVEREHFKLWTEGLASIVDDSFTAP